MTEVAVRFACHAGEIGVADGIGGKGPDHLNRNFSIGPSGEAKDGRWIELRPGIRHVETAVAGETRKHRLAKSQRGGLASRRNVSQPTASLMPQAVRDTLNLLIFRDVRFGRHTCRPSRAKVTIIEGRDVSQGR